jgi:hypothetical protein
VEIFLKIIAPYFPGGSKIEEIQESEPHTPPGFCYLPASISEFPVSQITKTLRFGKINVMKILPIPSITSQRRPATLLNDEPEENSSSKVNTDQRKEQKGSTNPFSRKQTPRESEDNYPKDLKSS